MYDEELRHQSKPQLHSDFIPAVHFTKSMVQFKPIGATAKCVVGDWISHLSIISVSQPNEPFNFRNKPFWWWKGACMSVNIYTYCYIVSMPASDVSFLWGKYMLQRYFVAFVQEWPLLFGFKFSALSLLANIITLNHAHSASKDADWSGEASVWSEAKWFCESNESDLTSADCARLEDSGPNHRRQTLSISTAHFRLFRWHTLGGKKS